MLKIVDKLVKTLCHIAEDQIMTEAWSVCEDDFKLILQNDNYVLILKKVFIRAIMDAFLERIRDSFTRYGLAKLIERSILNKIRKVRSIDMAIGTSEENIAMWLRRKVCEEQECTRTREEYISVINEELNSIQEIKQRLKFRITKISQKKYELNNLLNKKDEMMNNLEESALCLN